LSSGLSTWLMKRRLLITQRNMLSLLQRPVDLKNINVLKRCILNWKNNSPNIIIRWKCNFTYFISVYIEVHYFKTRTRARCYTRISYQKNISTTTFYYNVIVFCIYATAFNALIFLRLFKNILNTHFAHNFNILF